MNLYGVPLSQQLATHWRQYREAPAHMKSFRRGCVRICINHIRWRKEGWLGEVNHD